MSCEAADTWISKVKNVVLDAKTVSASEMLGSLEKNNFTCSSKEILSDILEGVVPYVEHKCQVGDDVYHDVEFFESFSTKGSSTIFGVVSSTCELEGAKEVLNMIMGTPIHNKDILRQRQKILQELQTSSKHETRDIAPLEKDVMWIFQEEDQNLKDLYDMVFFRFCMLKPLNRSGTALSFYNLYRIIGSPIIGLLSPIVYFLVPYLVISFKFKMKVSFKVYVKILIETMLNGDMFAAKGGGSYKYFKVVSYVLSVLFYFQGIFNSFEISKTIYKVSKHIVTRMNNVITFLKEAFAHVQTHWKDDMHTFFLSPIDTLLPKEAEATYMDSLSVLPFKLTSNFGQQLNTFLTLDKTVVKSILLKFYILQGLWSCVDFQNRTGAGYVEYVEDVKPVMDVVQLAHPCIDVDRIVRNNIIVGGENNAIITGPNAGGKSTFVKSLLVNVLLAQTIGISAGHSCKMTPFYNISSQINVPDSKGYESLFEAEMYRCKAKLDMLKTLAPNQFSFFVMDEIFNSTNPVEGISGAYAIAKKMSAYSSCVLVFTTHYVYLTKLRRTEKFTNYRMNVIKDADDITYPYELEKGVSQQYIALDLLKKNGFDDDVIDEAVALRNKLVTRV